MNLVVIDLDLLQKKVDQHETLAVNEEQDNSRRRHYAVSHALQGIMSTTQPLEPIIDETWIAAQRYVNGGKDVITIPSTENAPPLSEFKKIKGWQSTK